MAGLVRHSVSDVWRPTPEAIDAALSGVSNLQRERWKYTRQSKIVDLLNALPAQTDTAPDSAHEVHPPLSASSLPDIERLLAETTPAALAMQLFPAVHRLEMAAGETLTLPATPVFYAAQIKVPEGCSVTLDETFEQADARARLIWIDLAPGARLTHSRNFFSHAQEWHYLHVSIGSDARYELHNHSLGGELHRQDILIDLDGAGGHAALTGSAVLAAGLHLDQQVRLQHSAPHATSTQTFHSIAGERANLTFGGRIHIHQGCDGTDAQLQNRNLALADNATINTKPELEIYAEDVKCAHGATVGQLDETQMFYCLSRGIAKTEARALLSQAFVRTATTGPLAELATERYSGVLM